MNTKLNSSALMDAIGVVDSVTPSVMVLARVAGVKPVDFAKAIADDEANSTFATEVATVLQTVKVKEAMEQRKTAKAKADAKDE